MPQPSGGEQASFPKLKNVPKYRAGTLLVRFKAKTSAQQMTAAHAAAQAQVLRTYRIVPNLQRVRLAQGVSVLRALREYRQNPAVQYAEPDYAVQAVGVNPNDPRYVDGSQWGLRNTGQNGGTAGADIDASDAWSITTGSSDVVVADIDTGIDYNHSDLAGRVWTSPFSFSVTTSDGSVITCPAGSHGFNSAYGTCDPMDDHGHGTHTAGTIGAAGNNGVGVAGVNWNVTIVACKFLTSYGSGYNSDAITCLEFLQDLKDNHGVNLVASNNSWGGGWYEQALSDAIDAQRQSGVLFMAAAGNGAADNDTAGFYPADYSLPNVIAVAATDRNDALATFSDWGKHTVSLGAPGVAIISTTPNNSYSTWSGTSMATPHVTGVAALLKAQDPSRDWRAIKNLILAGGDNKDSLADTITGKRLNAYGAMTCSNSEVLARLRPISSPALTQVGVPLSFSVLHINCDVPAGALQVTIDPGGTVLTLKDDGVAPDQAAGDGIYTGQFTPTTAGVYTATVSGGDIITVNVTAPYSFQTTTYDYRTIAGTNLNFTDDEVAQITPSFPIGFGGASFNSLWISANGTISFDSPYSEFGGYELPLPSWRAGPATLVAPFWTDFAESGTQNVFWAETGTAPNRELVVEWRDVYLYCPVMDEYGDCFSYPDESVRFEVVFSESNTNILFNYADATFGGNSLGADDGWSASVGVQVGPDSGTQFSWDTPSLADNMALLWTINGPQIYSVAPTSAVQGTPDFTLTVNGTNFAADSVVRWYGVAKPTTFVNSTQLTATISAADLCHTGTEVQVVTVLSGGLTSNGGAFTIIAPEILSLVPASATAGGPDFTLTVNGRYFVDGTVVTWNGSSRPTTFVNANQVTVAVSSSDIATPETAELIPVNLAGCSDNSFAGYFNVEGPAISSLAPSTATAGGPSFTLTVHGSNFLDGAVVDWNGSARPTAFVNSGQLTAAISAADIATPGTEISVTVQNPSGIASNPGYFEVSPPAISSITPSSVAAGGPTFTLTVNGSNFVNGAMVILGDCDWEACQYPPTTFVNSGQLTAVVDASSITIAGGVAVSVRDPGGAPSNFASLTVAAPAVSSLSPASAPAGGPSFTLTVNGSNFVAGSVVSWNGSGRLTTFVNSGQLTATISAADIANPGTVGVNVVNPGGAASSAVPFTVLSPTLTVTSPNGGESWNAGSTYNITWTHTGSPGGSMQIILLKSGVPQYTIASSVNTFSGSYTWTIPSNQVAGSDYRVQIVTSSGPQITDTSDANFTIASAGTVTVILPNGAESWMTGTTHAITWTHTGTPGPTLQINLLKAGIQQYVIASGLDTNSGSFSWSIPVGQSAGSDYRIQIVTSAPQANDTSDADFAITQPALILNKGGSGRGTVTSTPAGISCGPDCGASTAHFAPGTVVTLSAMPASGSAFTGWTGACAGTGSCTVTLNSDVTVGASFDNRFVVVSPNGGEQWASATTHTVSWTYANVNTLSVNLLKGGVFQYAIFQGAAGINGSGSYAWAIPAGQAPGNDYRVQIVTTDGSPQAIDTSDADFSIIPTALTVTSPNGGESWTAGTAHAITWTYTGSPGNVKLELWKAGVLSATLASSIPAGSNGSGSFSWSIPASQPAGTDYQVRITSLGNASVNDSSNANFAITTPPSSMRVSSPNGGERWNAGTIHPITWSYTGSPGTLRIELLKSGVVVQTISAGAPVGTNGSGSFSWTIPGSTALGTTYRVRVTSTANPGLTDTSDADFGINRTGIVVSTPNGGETWQAGSTQTIRWTYYGAVGTAVRIDLYKAGVLNRTLVTSTPISSGQYSWTVPSTQAIGADYKVKVTSAPYATYSDMSDGNFAIVNTGITVTSPNGGEVWAPGSTHNITWSYAGTPGTDLKIELLKGGVVNSTLAAAAPIAGGSFTWTVPANQALGADYSVRVTSNQNGQYSDTSNANFTIDQRYTLTVTKGGTGTATITSSPSGINCPSTCSATFSAGTLVTLTAAPSAGTTFNGWSGACSGAGSCQVTMNSDISVGAAFTGPAVSITVTSPNGGESWWRGTVHPITWTYSGNPGTGVKIELLKSGVVNRTLTLAAPIGSSGSGSYNWTVPLLQVTGSDFTIRVTSSTQPAITDTSNAPFTIR